MSLYRDLCDASIEADLTKNENKVFIMLLKQTLGYGKSQDNLTDNRLVGLTGLRLDRLRTAINGVVKKGLFEIEPSRHYQYHYQIAQKFLDKHTTFFTPSSEKQKKPL
jgi:phage replication O-like protein O